MMRLYLMFVTAVCMLFLIKLRWRKKNSIYDMIYMELKVFSNMHAKYFLTSNQE